MISPETNKLRIDVISLFPQMFDAVTKSGITGRAVENQRFDLQLWNPRDFTTDKHRTVDDRPYGGGPGMVMRVQPLQDAIVAAKTAQSGQRRVIYLSPQGRRFDQQLAQELLTDEVGPILVAGRYEGVDQRLIDHSIDEEISIGDYVLSGGEIAAMVIIDAMVRLLPDVLGHADSASQDSFSNGLLDYPHYTRPELTDSLEVPDVLLSGDHQAISRWRQKQALGITWQKRPDLLQKIALDEEQQKLLKEFIQEYEQR